jgi:UDP-N-acetyl-D-glucosamine dehydrogenase
VKSTNVVVVGQGYVGLPLSIAIAKAGFKVLGFDLNHSLVEKLNAGISHIEDIPNESLAESLVAGNYKATSNPSDFFNCEIAIIAVPTPLNDEREPDLSFIEAASKILGENLLKSTLIINESTSYPGTLRDVIAPIVNGRAQKGVVHSFAISPERVDPGNINWKIKNTPRILAGLSLEARQHAREFYSSFCDELVEVSSPEVAEAAKLFENTFRQVNIALVNEFAQITNSLGISVREVLDAASTKPYGFMKFTPGVGVGGHCIPVDPSYLAYVAEKNGIAPSFINLANKVNLAMPEYIVKRIEDLLGGQLIEKKILICGMAYKKDVADVRESPSALLVKELRSRGAIVAWHDPFVQEWSGEKSTDLFKDEFDLTFVAVNHTNLDLNKVSLTSAIVFDATSSIPLAISL